MGLNGMNFKSNEERFFWDWLKEAEKYGLVQDIIYQPESFKLSDAVFVQKIKHLKTKIKYYNKSLLRKHDYTADFYFSVVNIRLAKTFNYNWNGLIYVDTKGAHPGKRNNSAITFPLNQKWVWDKYGIYVEKVIPKELFKKTWVPESAMSSPVLGKPVKQYIGCKTIKDYIRELEHEQDRH